MRALAVLLLTLAVAARTAAVRVQPSSATPGRITVLLGFAPVPSATAVTTTAGDSVQGQPWGAAQTHALPGAATADSFSFPSGGRVTGYIGVKACNAWGCSPMQYRPWSFVTLDTLVPVRLYVASVPASVQTSGKIRYCPFGQLANGSWYPADPRADTTAVCRTVYDTIHLAGGPKLQPLSWSGTLP